MNYFEQTYKQFSIKLLLGLYLVANFSTPIMEGIHFLLHLTDGSQLHSFQSHSNVHSHKTLEVLGDLLVLNNAPDTPHTSDSNKKFKKNIQFIETPLIFSFEIHSGLDKIYHPPLTYYKSPFLSINSPPPDIQIS